MDFPTNLNRRYTTIAITILAAIWLWVAFDRPYVFPDHIPWNIYSSTPQAAPPDDFFRFLPFISPAIKEMCDNTQWNTSLVFTCDSPAGSFAEVRNSVLSCVRYTIAAGGSLVMPKMVLQEDYGGLLAGNTTGLDHLFDTEHLTNFLEMSCPQLQLHTDISSVKDIEKARGPNPLSPETLASTKDRGYSYKWREGLTQWLAKYISSDADGSIIISLAHPYLRYPINLDDDAFVHHFGMMLKIRFQARKLATTAILKLSQYSGFKNIMSRPGFLAAYLSTAPDPDRVTKEEQHYARYETQSQLYLDYASISNLSGIYIASNQITDVARFTADAQAKKIQVLSKFDLLKGSGLAELQDMTAIQREMIDYLMMNNAAMFLGAGFSAFSWNEALKRHGPVPIQQPSEQGQLFKDGSSVIYGQSGGHNGFLESMWP